MQAGSGFYKLAHMFLWLKIRSIYAKGKSYFSMRVLDLIS